MGDWRWQRKEWMNTKTDQQVFTQSDNRQKTDWGKNRTEPCGVITKDLPFASSES